jgi:hypothetical protein
VRLGQQAIDALLDHTAPFPERHLLRAPFRDERARPAALVNDSPPTELDVSFPLPEISFSTRRKTTIIQSLVFLNLLGSSSIIRIMMHQYFKLT